MNQWKQQNIKAKKTSKAYTHTHTLPYMMLLLFYLFRSNGSHERTCIWASNISKWSKKNGFNVKHHNIGISELIWSSVRFFFRFSSATLCVYLLYCLQMLCFGADDSDCFRLSLRPMSLFRTFAFVTSFIRNMQWLLVPCLSHPPACSPFTYICCNTRCVFCSPCPCL